MGTFSEEMQITEWTKLSLSIDQAQEKIDQMLNGDLELANEAFRALGEMLFSSYLKIMKLNEKQQKCIINAEDHYLKHILQVYLLKNKAEKNCPIEECAEELSIDVTLVQQAYEKIQEGSDLCRSEIFKLLIR